MIQVARNLTDEFDGPLSSARFLIMDRHTKFTKHFKGFLRRGGVEAVVYPPRAPNCSPYAERFVRSIKEECLDRVIPIGVASLRRAVTQYIDHYHIERNHQGLGNELIHDSDLDVLDGPIRRRERLGGLLNYYYRPAA